MWKLYRVVFRLHSPLHVGWLKIGNLMRTRPYVLGKTIWGAVTAALAMKQFSGDFLKTREKVSRSLAFSYFYPALEKEAPLWPCYTDEGLCYGAACMPAAEFERRLLAAYGSTALDYSCNAAAAGSLHEVEFISPYDHQEGKPVYLVGYIFERQGSQVRWQDVLSTLWLGGERKSGWGQVRLDEKPSPSEKLFGCALILDEERPAVKVEANRPILAHAVAHGIRAQGQIEPLVGRETREAARFGEVLPSWVPICWVPGSRLLADQLFEISEYGIWQCTSF